MATTSSGASGTAGWAMWAGLFRAAKARTRIRLGLFALARALRRRVGVDLYQGGEFDFRFGRFEVRQGRGDLGTIAEVFLRRIYAEPGFLPAEGETCVDVGANIGCVTLFWRRTNRRGQIVAIEPHPGALGALRRNLQLNGMDKATVVVDAAAAARCAPIELVLDQGGQTMARNPALGSDTMQPYDAEVRAEVRGMTLDQILADCGIEKVDLLKIDVEGFEIDCLDGAPRTLERARRVVLEYHSPVLRAESIQRLRAHGFDIVERGQLLLASRRTRGSRDDITDSRG